MLRSEIHLSINNYSSEWMKAYPILSMDSGFVSLPKNASNPIYEVTASFFLKKLHQAYQDFCNLKVIILHAINKTRERKSWCQFPENCKGT
jgi:hypothetical protein